MRSRTWACAQGWSAACARSTSRTASRIGSRARMILASRAVIPSPPLPSLIATGRGRAVHDLHQPAGLADEVGTFLDRGAVGRGAGADRGLVARRRRRRGLCCAGDDAGGQPVERIGRAGSRAARPSVRGRQV